MAVVLNEPNEVVVLALPDHGNAVKGSQPNQDEEHSGYAQVNYITRWRGRVK